MRKFLYLFFLPLAFAAHASTSITTATVSGHWTLAGSPYLIYNDIQIAGGAALAIDPGVQVFFQGVYNLDVVGILKAAGTLSAPIAFTIADTTGFSSNADNCAGGWH